VVGINFDAGNDLDSCFLDVRIHSMELTLWGCWITIYPVGCRDLYVVIKINTLERVSLLLHVIYSTSVDVDVALSVRGEEDLSRE